ENAETIYYLYVVDDDSRLVGVLTLRDLITSDANRLVSEAMSPRVVTVSVDDNQQDVARTIQDYDFLAIPDIEATGELLG
ncbi:CBS domain-containing protein, partial [Actinotignum timonense]|nr:CBS domain-containing protein [Actinotignum timonense]